MVNVECEGLVPYRVQGTLLEACLYALVFNLNDHVWIGCAVHVQRLEIPCLDTMHGEEAAYHDPVLIKLLRLPDLLQLLEHLIPLTLVIHDSLVGLI